MGNRNKNLDDLILKAIWFNDGEASITSIAKYLTDNKLIEKIGFGQIQRRFDYFLKLGFIEKFVTEKRKMAGGKVRSVYFVTDEGKKYLETF